MELDWKQKNVLVIGAGVSGFAAAKLARRFGAAVTLSDAKTEEELEKKAQEALQQMEERDYDAEFRARGVRTMHHYGIAFCGKQVKVLGKSLDLT